MQTDNQLQELTPKEQQELTGGNWVTAVVKAIAEAVRELFPSGPQV